MALQADYFKRIFHFNFQARTSRGLMKEKTSWFIRIWDETNPEIIGIGECGPLPDLSPDAVNNFEDVLKEVIKNVPLQKSLSGYARADVNMHIPEYIPSLERLVPPNFPSILFGMETALLDLMHGGKRIIFKNYFTQGSRIPINGLIWMGDFDFMIEQIDEKIKQGFRCIKLKVGGLDFDRECEVLQYVRENYADDITLRIDANGAFETGDALAKLNVLKQFNIHSIEQPIKKGLDEMEELCRKSPIPVALDEELIGCENGDDRTLLLTRLRPGFVVLKPTLHGGFSGCRSWINIAQSLGIGWWITSALESNIGLNAICQFTANYPITLPQGLGTGAIYIDNFDSALRIEKGSIFQQFPMADTD